MKLVFVIGIFVILCIQISHQIPFGKKDRKIPFPIPDKDFVGVKPFNFQVKNHGVRDVGQDGPGIGDGIVGGKTIDDIKHQKFGKRFKHKDIKDGDGIFVDTDTVVEEKVLTKRGGLIKKIKEKVKEHLPFVKRDVDEPQIGMDEEKSVISKSSNFDLGSGVHVDQIFVDSEIEKEKEIQHVKRGWFKKLWKKIKNVVVESLLGMIKRSSNDLQKQDPIKNENDLKDIEVVELSDDIIEVDLGNDFKNEEEKEKAIQKVKRGWFKKIRRKIVKILTGAVVGSVVGGVVKRENGNKVEKEEEVVADAPKINNLPLLLKTLRLRPRTADQITEIVQKLGGDLNGQDPEIVVNPEKDVVPQDVKPQGKKLPLLLKTLRLRPGTADQITEIVQKLGGDTGFQDEMIDEILNDEDGVVEDDEDNTVLERNGKSVRCRFVRGKFICF